MKVSMRALTHLDHIIGRIPKFAGDAAWGLRFHALFSTYMTTRPSYNNHCDMPPLVSSITDQVPHLVLPPVADEDTGEIVFRMFNPINEEVVGIKKKRNSILPNTARHFWSSNGLVAFVDFNECGLYLWAPPFSSFSDLSDDIIELPSIVSLPSVVGLTRNTDGSVEEFRLLSRGSEAIFLHDMKKEDFSFLVRQLALSSVPSSASSISNSGCTVMAIQGKSGSLAFFKLGDTTWTDLPTPYETYQSITYCSKDQLFYAISSTGTIEAWDVHDPSSTKRISVDRYVDYPMPKYKGNQAKLRLESDKKFYLVESSEDLLLVVRHYIGEHHVDPRTRLHHHHTVGFDVYKFDLASPTNWTYVEHLEDRALFVGQTSPFSLSTRDFPGLMGNSIYFADDEQNLSFPHYKRTGGHDVGVFNLQDNDLKRYYPFGSLTNDNVDDPPAVWIAPNTCG